MDNIKIKGRVKITHLDKNGKILEVEEGHNLIVNQGLEYLAKLLNGVSILPFKYMQIGIGTTSPVGGNTTLETPITTPSGMVIKEATCEYLASYISKIYATFTNNDVASIDVTEAGIFDAIAPGNMLCRKVFGAKTLVQNESLVFEWQLTISTS